VINCSGNGEDKIHVIANTDIEIPLEAVNQIKDFFQIHPGKALALSRWDAGEPEPVLFNRADSQDVWAIRGIAKGLPTRPIEIGRLGCDNRFAWELLNMGYDVVNLGATIRTLHHHATEVRYYYDNEGNLTAEIVPPPYHLIQPQ